MKLNDASINTESDIVIDAWRIEAASDSDEVGLMTSAAQLGYRIAMLVTDALVIAIASRIGWPLSYVVMAVLMSIGVVATFFAFEPVRADIVLESKPPLWTPRGLMDAAIGPFVALLRQAQDRRPPDAADDRLVPPARFRDGADVQPVLPRPWAHQGHGRVRARHVWSGRGVCGHRRRRV